MLIVMKMTNNPIIHSEILRLVIGTAIGMAYYYLTSKKIMPDEIEHALYFFKRG